MQETGAVAERLGIALPISIDQRIAGAAKVGEHKTSMLQDVEAGRPMELEAVVDACVELGERLGIPMPATRAVYACAALLNDRLTSPGAASARTPGAAPARTPDAAPQRTPDAASQGTPDAASQRTPDAAPQRTPDARCRVPRDARRRVPRDARRRVPRDARCRVPRDARCRVPRDARCRVPRDARCRVPRDARCRVPKDARCRVPRDARCRVPKVARRRVPKDARRCGSSVRHVAGARHIVCAGRQRASARRAPDIMAANQRISMEDTA